MLFPSCVRQLERDALLGRPVSSWRTHSPEPREPALGTSQALSLHTLRTGRGLAAPYSAPVASAVPVLPGH